MAFFRESTVTMRADSMGDSMGADAMGDSMGDTMASVSGEAAGGDDTTVIPSFENFLGGASDGHTTPMAVALSFVSRFVLVDGVWNVLDHLHGLVHGHGVLHLVELRDFDVLVDVDGVGHRDRHWVLDENAVGEVVLALALVLKVASPGRGHRHPAE